MFSNTNTNKSRMFCNTLNISKNTNKNACSENKSATISKMRALTIISYKNNTQIHQKRIQPTPYPKNQKPKHTYTPINDQKYHVKQTPIRPSNSIIHTDIPLYSNEMLNKLRHSENKKWYPVQNTDYLQNMKDVTLDMRLKLIHWLMEVHRSFHLTPPTLFLSINLIDRVLPRTKTISRWNLQLIGCCCLWIASKYHELTLPMADDFICISDYAFTHPQLVEIEGKILKMLDFDLTVPTVYTYIQRYANIAMSYVSNNEKQTNVRPMKIKANQKLTKDLMMFCVEYACVSYDLYFIKPSKLAAAVFVYVCFGLRLVNEQRYVNDGLCEVLGYKVEELLDVVRDVHMVVKRDSKCVRFPAIRLKYKSRNLSGISRRMGIFGRFKNEYFMDGSKNGCGISGKYGGRCGELENQ